MGKPYCFIDAAANAGCRSSLFNTTTAFFPCASAKICVSSCVRGRDWSITIKIISALSMYSLARRTPICSTVSWVLRIPAVSTRQIGTPFSVIHSSITSRVVPGTSVTIARSSCSSLLSRLDFPALGVPVIAVMTPSRIIRPLLDAASISSSRCSISLIAPAISGTSISSKSSSG